MRVLALASQKGGSGKTTLSGHLAVQAQRAGAGPVVLIDIDPQGSLSDWWNEREAEFPAFAQTTVARLASDLALLRQQGFRLAVIDTPPGGHRPCGRAGSDPVKRRISFRTCSSCLRYDPATRRPKPPAGRWTPAIGETVVGAANTVRRKFFSSRSEM